MSKHGSTRSLIFLLLFSFFSVAAHAEINCSTLAGFWRGIFTLKDENACKEHQSCTHLVGIRIDQSQNNFKAKLRYPIGIEIKQIPFTCEKGVVTVALPMEYEFNTRCDTNNQCFITFNTPFFYAELSNS